MDDMIKYVPEDCQIDFSGSEAGFESSFAVPSETIEISYQTLTKQTMHHSTVVGFSCFVIFRFKNTLRFIFGTDGSVLATEWPVLLCFTNQQSAQIDHIAEDNF